MEKILHPINIREYQPISREVFKILREAILGGSLQPGTRLVEREIARQLGVSRTPVREAIHKLEQEGLVRHIPRRGVVVAQISEREVHEVYMIRAVLEGLAARLAAERISPGKLKRLSELMEAMEKACERNDEQTLQTLHLEFNTLIYEAAESPRLHQMINYLVDYIAAFTKLGYSVPGRMRAATQEHRALAEALTKGDGRLAEEIARRHIENSREAYFMKKYFS
ncbi:GntR family transcriptional regulator [Thermosediminibacter litoriperuensis]|uniref:GntR family transcriptional regulator n=1 Tax=Thermosediminibacter litoriperuensis TaxID=291989 RepID=A0A5S5ASG7_9FIRM|nr:GntR family transcriptional regulator [Thermosediminibacter litoriperuensis]TYP53755.1 GntR family transcriptional regulator [Thermosediminibacter litoriperuensis]